jgi:hypothetical protein
MFGGLAHLGERLICIQEVAGSIPVSSTKYTLGGVAQLVRAIACHAIGRGFESLHSRHVPVVQLDRMLVS